MLIKTFEKEAKGQALIELIIGFAILTIVLTSITFLVIGAREARERAANILAAQNASIFQSEALRSVRESDWNNLQNGVYHIEQSGDSWSLVAGSQTLVGFTRQIDIEDTCRDDNSSIVDCPSGRIDGSTKRVTVTISWSLFFGGSTTNTYYLTRYLGNATWVQTTKADFETGTHDNTTADKKKGGLVRLDQAGGTQSFTDNYDFGGAYNYDLNKIDVTGGFAQLKAQGPSESGQTTNSGFDADTSGWTFAVWGNNISQTGNFQASGGNPGGYAEINLPPKKKKKSGGYWYQPFTTTVNNPTATLTFDWRVTSYDPTPDSFRLYAFVDTGSGTPNTANAVWDSGEITGTTSWSSTVTVDVSSRVTNTGTYYLKVAVFVDYPNQNRGPYTVGYDNVLLSWSGASGSYPTDNPTINRNVSFTAPSITSWESFGETSETNGGSIRYQLSDDDGTTWKYFNGSSWVTVVGPTDYNDEQTLNNEISSFPTASNKINVKAFLISDGSQQVRLDQIIIGFIGSSIGTFTSSTFDADKIVGFNRIIWTENNTPNTTIRLQIATNTDNSTWAYVGPDGTSNTYFTGGSGSIPLTSVSGRYFQYRIYFTSSNTDKPDVEDVTVNYSP